MTVEHEHTADRTLPADINAERATLGALLLDRDAILALHDWFRPGYFYLEKHAWVYEAMLACFYRQTPPDIATVAHELTRH
jgi:replicative DNA helicase